MKKGIFLVSLLIFVVGCALDIRTTGYLDRASGVTALTKGTAFAVMENAQAENPIFDREVKGKLEKMLTKRGYRIAPPETADYLLTYGYSIGPGFRSSVVTSYGLPQTQITSVPDGRGGVTTRAVTTPGQPFSVPMISTEYTRQLTVKVADAARQREDKKEHVIWVGETHSIDPSSDLRYDVDYLLVVTFAYFGQDTGKQVRVNLGPEDPEVLELRSEAGSAAR
jgi:hypothetical protein